ncbi:MAG TPA: hypothetical protein VF134_06925 [Candidatus Dormibacteraeota bacterium]
MACDRGSGLQLAAAAAVLAGQHGDVDVDHDLGRQRLTFEVGVGADLGQGVGLAGGAPLPGGIAVGAGSLGDHGLDR